MYTLDIKQLDPKSLTEYESWFDNWAASNVLFKQANFDDLIRQGAHAWVGSINNEIVSVAFYTRTITREGYLYFAVKPAVRRKGIGAEMMSKVLNEPLVKDLSSAHVSVSSDNIAGQKVLRRTGFIQTNYSPEDYIEFEKI
jgi:predicted acetyltransferase